MDADQICVPHREGTLQFLRAESGSRILPNRVRVHHLRAAQGYLELPETSKYHIFATQNLDFVKVLKKVEVKTSKALHIKGIRVEHLIEVKNDQGLDAYI